MSNITDDLKRGICALFEVHADERGVQRVVTPLEYSGTGDNIVVRIRPRDGYYQIDDNGEASFLAALNGGNTESELLQRWATSLPEFSPVSVSEEDVVIAKANDGRLLAPYALKVAAAAQQLYAFSFARPERQASDFRERLFEAVKDIVEQTMLPWRYDVALPIMGDLMADHILGSDEKPFIIIAANSPTRLLEAELIHMQFKQEKKPAYVLAVAENQAAVTRRQFERALYFTDKTVTFEPSNFSSFLRSTAASYVM